MNRRELLRAGLALPVAAFSLPGVASGVSTRPGAHRVDLRDVLPLPTQTSHNDIGLILVPDWSYAKSLGLADRYGSVLVGVQGRVFVFPPNEVHAWGNIAPSWLLYHEGAVRCLMDGVPDVEVWHGYARVRRYRHGGGALLLGLRPPWHLIQHLPRERLYRSGRESL